MFPGHSRVRGSCDIRYRDYPTARRRRSAHRCQPNLLKISSASWFRHSRKIRSNPWARRTRCRMPRQAIQFGGWSGSSAMTSMPRPGAMVSMRSRRSRVRRLETRCGAVNPAFTASMRSSTRVQSRSIPHARGHGLRASRKAKRGPKMPHVGLARGSRPLWARHLLIQPSMPLLHSALQQVARCSAVLMLRQTCCMVSS